MFTSNHIILVAASFILISGATFLSVRNRLSSKKVSNIFAVICVVNEIVKDMICMVPSEFGGYILDHDDIPLHLCSAVVFFMMAIVFTKKESIQSSLVSAVTIIGTIAPPLAMLIPVVGVDFSKAITYQYFIYHAALMWYAMHHLITRQADFSIRAYKKNLVYLTVITFFTLYMNSALSAYGVNFCFLRKPPAEGLPILNLDHGWYRYFLSLMAIGYGSVTLMHLPTMIKEKRKN